MGAMEMSGGGIRIGDAERDCAANALGEHLRAGRLDVAEYDERVMAAFSARTAEDVMVLFLDLPGGSPLGPHPVRPGPFVAPADRKPTPGGQWARQSLFVLIAVASIAWMAFTRLPPFFLFPLLFFALARRSFFGPYAYRRGAARTGYGPHDHRPHDHRPHEPWS